MISFNVCNGYTLEFNQEEHDKPVTVHRLAPSGEVDEVWKIDQGDFVMLWNLYNYVKDNDIRNDFINPYGSTTEAL